MKDIEVDLASPEFKADPYPFFARLREQAPVCRVTLARLEGEIAISTLLRRAPGLCLSVEPKALRWRRGLVLRGLEALPVILA